MKILPAILIISFILGGIYATQRPNHKVVFPNAQRSNFHSEIQRTAQKIREKREEARARAVFQNRVSKTKAILAGSPMETSAEGVVRCADSYSVPVNLLLAIAKHESGFGRNVGRLTHNAFGWGVHYGTTFDSWTDGACTVARGLALNYNLNSIEQVFYKYAPPSENNTEGYIANVKKFLAENKI